MLTIPNLLSFLRLPLAYLFIGANPINRALILTIAMVTDVMDGFIARKYKLSSHLGAILDPVTDKFFAATVLWYYWSESMVPWEGVLAILSRDIAVFAYGGVLLVRGKFSDYTVRAIWSGKVMTACQFLFFIALTLGLSFPQETYWGFAFLGCISFIELLVRDQ